MGCNCKNENIIKFSGETVEVKKTFKQKVNDILLGKEGVTVIGFFLFVFLTPLIIMIMNPLVIVILFNRLVLGKNIDLIKLISFSRNKKMKK